MRRVLAIVPARGGSKGIPNKNLLNLGGEPLLAHSINHAKDAYSVTDVCVTSDSDAILDVAASEFADFLVKRPPELSDDDAKLEPVLKHVLGQDVIGWDWDVVVLLQPTSPLRTPEDVDCCVALVDIDGEGSAFSACRLEEFTWQNGMPDYTLATRPNRQNRKVQTLVENGAVYAFKPSVLDTFDARLDSNPGWHIMPWRRSVQVDTPADWDLVKDLYEVQRLKGTNQWLK